MSFTCIKLMCTASKNVRITFGCDRIVRLKRKERMSRHKIVKYQFSQHTKAHTGRQTGARLAGIWVAKITIFILQFRVGAHQTIKNPKTHNTREGISVLVDIPCPPAGC